MISNLESFQSLIQNKFFVSIESSQDVLIFTSIEPEGLGNQLRAAATSANVIVFLPSINKIWARNSYYGVTDSEIADLKTRLTTIEGQVSTLGGSLTDLAAIVHTQGTTISNHTTTLSDHTSTLNTISGQITQLQNDVAALSPNNTSLSDLVADAVEDALNDQLETALGQSTTISSITQDISNIESALADKVEQDEFDALIEKIGINNWVWTEPTEQNPNPTNTTIVDTLHILVQNVSNIPHFAIEVVDTLPSQNISTTTIYLLRSSENADPTHNELFTEYIYVDLDKNKVDPNTNEPLPARWGWESLGRQYFNVTNYLDANAIQQIQDYLEGEIAALQSVTHDLDVQQIATNANDIDALQISVQNLETRLQNIIDSNGNFLLTGEDINTTSANNSNTIAQDISALQSNKLDRNALDWVIITDQN